MKKIKYFWNTQSAIIFLVLITVLIMIILIMIKNKVIDIGNFNNVIDSVLSLATLGFIYKVLKNLEKDNVLHRKKRVCIICSDDPLDIQLKFNTHYSDLCNKGYKIIDIKEVSENRIYIYYFAKLWE